MTIVVREVEGEKLRDIYRNNGWTIYVEAKVNNGKSTYTVSNSGITQEESVQAIQCILDRIV